jgi:hypothetical protein
VRTEEEKRQAVSILARRFTAISWLTTTGNKKNDFTVTFEPMDAGAQPACDSTHR